MIKVMEDLFDLTDYKQDKNLIEFGKRLRHVIDKHLKVSHTDFAAKIGFSRNYLSEVLNGKKSPSLAFFQALLEIEGINERYLFHGVGPEFIDTSKPSIEKYDYVSIFGSEETARKWMFYLLHSIIFRYDCMSYLMTFWVKNKSVIIEELNMRGIDESFLPRL